MSATWRLPPPIISPKRRWRRLPGEPSRTRRRSPASRRNRVSMYRIILFLLLIALAATGAAWVADQAGDVALTWSGWRVQATLPVFALGLVVAIVAAMIGWSVLRVLWRLPEKIRKARRERRLARGRHAI